VLLLKFGEIEVVIFVTCEAFCAEASGKWNSAGDWKQGKWNCMRLCWEKWTQWHCTLSRVQHGFFICMFTINSLSDTIQCDVKISLGDRAPTLCGTVFILQSLHFAWVVDDAKCIVATRICVSCVCVCLSVCLRPYAHTTAPTDPAVTWGRGRGCPLVVHYLADLQSVHRLRCYGNIMRTLVYTGWVHVAD